MCGFFQVIQKNKPINRERFIQSLNMMSHRGPDAKGTHFRTLQLNNGCFVEIAFGNQRLSILDLDNRSDQPYIENDNVLLFNGEIYNFNEIKNNLYKSVGLNFFTNGDTELISKVLTNKRYDEISSFNGMWALSFFNSIDSSIFISRDRYGKKPLFFYQDNERICISSTIKAIKNYLNINIQFKEKYLTNYLLYGDVYPSDSDETHFEGIKQILPGHNAILNLQSWQLTQNKYFDCSYNIDNDFSEKLKTKIRFRTYSQKPPRKPAIESLVRTLNSYSKNSFQNKYYNRVTNVWEHVPFRMPFDFKKKKLIVLGGIQNIYF